MDNFYKKETYYGYTVWKEDWEHGYYKQCMQKRVDLLHKEVPLCVCNDKVLFNLDYLSVRNEKGKTGGYELSLVHEREDGRWCDLRIYSISQEDLELHLEGYEKDLLEMWKVFYNGSKTKD